VHFHFNPPRRRQDLVFLPSPKSLPTIFFIKSIISFIMGNPKTMFKMPPIMLAIMSILSVTNRKQNPTMSPQKAKYKYFHLPIMVNVT